MIKLPPLAPSVLDERTVTSMIKPELDKSHVNRIDQIKNELDPNSEYNKYYTLGERVFKDLRRELGFKVTGLIGDKPKWVYDRLQEWGIDYDSLDARDRRDVLKKLRLEFKTHVKRERSRINKEISQLKGEVKEGEEQLHLKQKLIEKMGGAAAAMEDMVNKPMVMEKPQGSSVHHLLNFISDLYSAVTPDINIDIHSLGNIAAFVVEHDWNKAFAGAQDFHGGVVKLPYDSCVFEFRVSGVRVLCATVQGEYDDIQIRCFFGVKGVWLSSSDYIWKSDNIQSVNDKSVKSGFVSHRVSMAFLKLLTEQIRVVCIMLDAEVATTELVRTPTNPQEKRRPSGKNIMKDYHVVSLSKRTRAALPVGEEFSRGSHTKRRLHFRRGHWRHYADHKTWINWVLVGDPDLGFVDKHYKL